MRIRRIIFVVLAVVLLTGLVLVAARQFIAAQAIRILLAKSGMPVASVQVEHLGWASAQVTKLRFGDDGLKVYIADLRVDYQPARLWRGTLERVTVTGLEVDLRSRDAPPPVFVLPDWRALPVRQIDLAPAIIRIHDGSQVRRLQLQGVAGKGQVLHGRLLVDDGQDTLELLVLAGPGSSWRMELRDQDTRQSLVQALGRADEAATVAALELDLEGLSPWLKRNFGNEVLADVAGTAQLDVRITNDGLSGAYHAALKRWAFTEALVVPDIVASGRFRYAAQIFDSTFAVDGARKSLHGFGRVEHARGRQTGSVNVAFSPLQFQKTGLRLSHLSEVWEFPFDLHGGEVGLQATVAWRPGTNGTLTFEDTVRVSLREAAGVFNEVNLTGINTVLDLQTIERVRTRRPASFHAKVAEYGLILEDVSAVLTLMDDPGKGEWIALLSDVEAGVFGGRVRSDRIRYDIKRESSQFIVNVAALDLAGILDLQAEAGIAGTGSIDGDLPITIAGDVVSITGGLLAARPPGGVIAYRPGPDSKVPIPAELLRYLDNFLYHTLSARVRYTPVGILVLEIELKGVNPEQSDRQVNLNVRIEDDFATLMRALHVSDVVTQRVEEAISRQQ